VSHKCCDTTDPELFYCKRKLEEELMKGFEKRREQLLESLLKLQLDGFSLQQMLFIHSGRKQTSYCTQKVLS
jgi:hypothetical protein